MRIDTHPGQIYSKLPKSDFTPTTIPAAETPLTYPTSADRGDRFVSSVIGAAILGGSAALGAFYPQTGGITTAMGLSGLTGAVVGFKSQNPEMLVIGGATAAFVGAFSALAGYNLGPSFAVIAGGVGGALGYLISAK